MSCLANMHYKPDSFSCSEIVPNNSLYVRTHKIRQCQQWCRISETNIQILKTINITGKYPSYNQLQSEWEQKIWEYDNDQNNTDFSLKPGTFTGEK